MAVKQWEEWYNNLTDEEKKAHAQKMRDARDPENAAAAARANLEKARAAWGPNHLDGLRNYWAAHQKTEQDRARENLADTLGDLTLAEAQYTAVQKERREKQRAKKEGTKGQIQAELAKRELARRYYHEYLPFVQEQWTKTKFSDFLARTAQKFLETQTGNAYDILLIESPPQHGKSRTLTETLPSWYMGKNPEKSVLIASYDSVFAERFCRRNKEKITKHGKNLFGIGMGTINRTDEFELSNNKGRLLSRGIMSGITGNPADFVLIDDPIKNREEADSPTRRDKVWEEWQNSIKSRLSAGGKVIIIMTPWHEDDFAARVLRSEKNVTFIRLPIEAEDDDPLGRSPGEPLCPELGKDAAWLDTFKASYVGDPLGGARAWAALYQCSPRVEGGNLIHRDWWRFYNPDEIKSFASMLVSVDAAFKDGDKNDFVSIQVWGKRWQDYFLLYNQTAHMNFPATVEAIRTIRVLYPNAKMVLIEDKANGSAIIQTLQREMWCVPVQPKGGKVARVNAVAAAIESGHVFLPDGAPWVPAFLDEFSVFPDGAHDDQVDACSQALMRLIYSSGEVLSAEKETLLRKEPQVDFLNSPGLYDVYGDEYI